MASSVPGLETKNVSITDTAGHLLSADGASNTDQVTVTNQYELTLASKAETMLSQVYGPGKVVVRVAADLNFDETQKQTTTYTPESATPVQQSQSEETFSATAPRPVAPPASPAPRPARTVRPTSTARPSPTRSRWWTPWSRRRRRRPGTVERITAAAIIDESLNPAPDEATVKSLVAATIGVDADRGDDVVVQTLPFDAAAQEAIDDAASDAGAGGTSVIVDYARLGAAPCSSCWSRSSSGGA